MALRMNSQLCIVALFYVTIFYGLCNASANSQTPQPGSSLEPSLRVAIVGAGVAGASAAFHLHNLSHSVPISITIYDSESIVGGRVVSVPTLEAPQYVFEAGAPSFFKDDDCLAEAMESTGLRYPWEHPWLLPRTTGSWNGQGVVDGPSCNLESPSWKYLAQLTVRYGISAWRFHRAIVSASKRWKMLAALQTFDNVHHALREADLDGDIIIGSAEAYFQELGISSKFLSEFVEPCTRARFSQNLANVNAFSALMAARKAKETCVDDGNIELIKHMIDLSGADLRLNSTVVGITDGDTHRYRLSIASPNPYMNPADMVHVEYDIIILVFPLHEGIINLNVSDFSGLSTSGFPVSSSSSSSPRLYAESHVTHFSTCALLSAAFFNLSLNATIPYDLFTTKKSDNILSISRSEVCYKRACSGDDECDQCDDDNKMYRVVSRQRMSHNDLIRLLGERQREIGTSPFIDITWVHRQAWPQAPPSFGGWNADSGETGGKIEVAPHLFYLGGVDQVLGSMEMSCRMGRNVARLLLATRPGDINEMDDVAHSEL